MVQISLIRITPSNLSILGEFWRNGHFLCISNGSEPFEMVHFKNLKFDDVDAFKMANLAHSQYKSTCAQFLAQKMANNQVELTQCQIKTEYRLNLITTIR